MKADVATMIQFHQANGELSDTVAVKEKYYLEGHILSIYQCLFGQKVFIVHFSPS